MDREEALEETEEPDRGGGPEVQGSGFVLRLPRPQAAWGVLALALAAFAAVACSGDGLGAPGDDPSLSDKIQNFSTFGWRTDFSLHSVPYYEFVPGGPGKDGIPVIDQPKFIGFAEADEFLADREPVIALESRGHARAYPVQILIWHEIVNDAVGGVPVVVTFCPLCNSAVAFERELGGTVYDFGVTGKLRFSDLVMYDRQTESWWQQITGEAIVGELTGNQLEFLPASTISYGDFKAAYPRGRVLSQDTGFPDYVRLGRYGVNPYSGYDDIDSSPHLFAGHRDDRLPPMERVATVTLEGIDMAYPYSTLRQVRVVNDEVAGTALVVFFQPGTLSALDQNIIAESRDVGATAVFRRDLAGRRLTFAARGGEIVDEETGTRWNLAGRGIAGPLSGAQLEPLVHGDYFWFAWVVFRPDTVVWQPPVPSVLRTTTHPMFVNQLVSKGCARPGGRVTVSSI